jgi:hypothetical protein
MGIRGSSSIKLVKGRVDGSASIESAPAASATAKTARIFRRPPVSEDWEGTLWYRADDESLELRIGDFNCYDEMVPADADDLESCAPLPLKKSLLQSMEKLPRNIAGDINRHGTRELFLAEIGNDRSDFETALADSILVACAKADMLFPEQGIENWKMGDAYPSGDGKLVLEVGFNATKPPTPDNQYHRDVYRATALVSCEPARNGREMLPVASVIRTFGYAEKTNEVYRRKELAREWARTNGKRQVTLTGDFTTDLDDENMNHWDRFAAKRVQAQVRKSARELFDAAEFMPPAGHDFVVEDDFWDYRHDWKRNIFTGKYSGVFDFALEDKSGNPRHRKVPVLVGTCKVSQTDDGIKMDFDIEEGKA